MTFTEAVLYEGKVDDVEMAFRRHAKLSPDDARKAAEGLVSRQDAWHEKRPDFPIINRLLELFTDPSMDGMSTEVSQKIAAVYLPEMQELIQKDKDEGGSYGDIEREIQKAREEKRDDDDPADWWKKQ